MSDKNRVVDTIKAVYSNGMYSVYRIEEDSDGNNWTVVNLEDGTTEYHTPVKPQAILICQQFGTSMTSKFWEEAEEDEVIDATMNKLFNEK